MLLNHESDPHENVNIAGYPEMDTKVNELSGRIGNFTASTSFRRKGKEVSGVTSQ